MKRTAGISFQAFLLAGLWGFALLAAGCDVNGQPPARPAADPARPALPPTPLAPAMKRTLVGKNVYFEVDPKDPSYRRVLVTGYICLRDGQLEGFMTRKNTKEHEYIVAVDCDARDIHRALIAAGAQNGSPVFFGEKGAYAPAKGTKINVSVRFSQNGQLHTVPAQQWIRSVISKKELEHSWVFAGSRLIPHPEDPTRPPFYAANSGDLICVCNMPDAMLDLPVKNPNSDPELRVYQAWTERIPPLDTPVQVILEPVRQPQSRLAKTDWGDVPPVARRSRLPFPPGSPPALLRSLTLPARLAPVADAPSSPFAPVSLMFPARCFFLVAFSNQTDNAGYIFPYYPACA